MARYRITRSQMEWVTEEFEVDTEDLGDEFSEFDLAILDRWATSPTALVGAGVTERIEAVLDGSGEQGNALTEDREAADVGDVAQNTYWIREVR